MLAAAPIAPIASTMIKATEVFYIQEIDRKDNDGFERMRRA